MRGAAVSVLLFANVAAAQSPGAAAGAPRDTGTKPEVALAQDWKEPEPNRFRGSALVLDNSTTTQTLGIGEDYQSSNPTYELSLSVAPRYLLWDKPKVRSVGLRGRIDVIREFTNSDKTTEQGEWTFSDAELGVFYSQNLADSDGYKTDLGLGIPNLSLPTSQVSANNGKILSIGPSVTLTQVIPVRKDEAILPSARGGVRLGYNYQFTRAVVPTNEGIERVRTDPTGRTVPSDQLSGATFSQHQGSVTILAALDITEVVSVDTELGWRPAYKYDLPDEVTVDTLTGPYVVESSEDAPNFTVTTLFHVGLLIDAPRPFGFSVGYDNVTLQLGQDGQRRNMFWSPDARFAASVILHVDQFLDKRGVGSLPKQTASRR